MQTQLPATDRIKNWMLDRSTGPVALAALNAMAVGLRLKGRARRHLYAERPDGSEEAFAGSFVFTTMDGSVTVNAVMAKGRMRVGWGGMERPEVTVTLKDRATMRKFFSPKTDPLNMLLSAEMSFNGNLAYLARFDHLSKLLRLGDTPLPPDPHKARETGRWQDLKAPPAGEPCGKVPAGEVTHLTDPYLAQHTLDEFPSLKRLLWAHRTVRPQLDIERPLNLTEYKLSNGPPPAEGKGAIALYQAKAIHYLLTHKRAIIHDDDVLAGTTTSRRIGVTMFPDTGATAIWPELLTVQARALNPYSISAEDVEILSRRVLPFWMDDNIREWARKTFDNPLSMRLDERFVLYFLWKNFAISHTVADLPAVLSRGLQDIRDEARRRERDAADADTRAFYRALQISLEGVMDYAGRLADEAEAQAATMVNGAAASQRRRDLEELARICRKVPARPAETLHEAVQAIWIVFLCLHQENFNAGLSFGRLDLWLEPFWQRDLEGVTQAQEKHKAVMRAVELVGALMLKATDHLPLVPDIGNRLFGGSSSDQVITLGGVKPNGDNAVGDMTWIFLKAVEMLRLRDPNVNARHAPGTSSEAYLRRLCELNLLTHATPSIHNDDAVIPSLVAQGFSLADARDWSATGCVEPTSCGRHFGHTGCIMFNLVAPLEMALGDGVHPLLGGQVGPRTGDPRDFETYEAFWEAYKIQLCWLLDQVVEGNNLLGRTHQAIKPTPLLSAVFSGPMEHGRDLVEGGAHYNTTGSAMVALTDVVDSLAAIKRLIFERREISFDQLLAALAADFQGHEELQQRIAREVPCFGAGDPLPVELAGQLMQVIYDHLTPKKNYRGGHYLPGYWSMSNHVAFGLLSGALPSGRRKGTPFTPGLTPAPRTGSPLTEQIRTVAELDRLLMPNNIAFNIKLVPGALDDHQQVLDRMTAYVQAYLDLGGMQLQFNVTSSETFRKAMASPDDYRDLLVRISGYNAYFVDLNQDMQNELIDRMEHHLG